MSSLPQRRSDLKQGEVQRINTREVSTTDVPAVGDDETSGQCRHVLVDTKTELGQHGGEITLLEQQRRGLPPGSSRRGHDPQMATTDRGEHSLPGQLSPEDPFDRSSTGGYQFWIEGVDRADSLFDQHLPAIRHLDPGILVEGTRLVSLHKAEQIHALKLRTMVASPWARNCMRPVLSSIGVFACGYTRSRAIVLCTLQSDQDWPCVRCSRHGLAVTACWHRLGSFWASHVTTLDMRVRTHRPEVRLDHFGIHCTQRQASVAHFPVRIVARTQEVRGDGPHTRRLKSTHAPTLEHSVMTHASSYDAHRTKTPLAITPTSQGGAL